MVIVENMAEVPKIMGLTISKDKLKDMVEIPNMTAFVGLIETAERDISILKPYVTIENHILSLANDFEEQIELRYSIFADTPKQIAAHNILSTLATAMNDYTESLNIDPENVVEGLLIEGKIYKVDGKFIKRF